MFFLQAPNKFHDLYVCVCEAKRWIEQERKREKQAKGTTEGKRKMKTNYKKYIYYVYDL